VAVTVTPEQYESPLAAIRAAVEILGGQAPTARICEVSQPTVWRWVKGKSPVTPRACPIIEEFAGIAAAILRPDIFVTEAPSPSAPPLIDQAQS
jgi:DNA-binding transcriptional regulator YdaS (Cro superfamily)